MKKFCKLSVAFLVLNMGLSFLISCSNQSNERSEADMKIDSLTQLSKKQKEQIGNMEGFISSIAETMDSINTQELELIKNGNIERRGTGKSVILNNLKRYKETIQRQKEMISQLEQRLSEQKDAMSEKMLQIVAFYKKELDAKDQTIAKLQSDIASNKKDISILKEEVDNLTATKLEMDKTIKEQDATLLNQTNMINKAYIKIGSKKDLKAAGLLKGGLFAKKKLDTSSLKKELFQEVDMRSCNELQIQSSNPKILSPMPESSYKFVKDDKGNCYLHIISPDAFWSVSKFLVIQL